MAKRGYKLQEFMAHSGSVNCLSIGKKTARLFVTGGDDQKVNLWSIGKPTSLMSLCGHTNPVQSVAFDSTEVLVVGGASAGAIKLWDLEETKMVRTLTGHRSNCTAVEFHPFGEFFASGSMDTNLKIWDIRKKGCIHTYKSHTRGISTIRFTPDGRWVVSGGFDNVVKIWDLTAGKLLTDFKLHGGHIHSIDFHPLEFLLATGSADRTVKFWDLETFELIGSTRPESTGVQSIMFHPDGRTLFSGLDDSLKVYSWEPVACHDVVDMGWSTLGDLCIQDGNLLGCSYYRNSVGVWVADISLIEPYGAGSLAEQNDSSEERHNLRERLLEKGGSHRRSGSTPNLSSISPDSDTKEIKNIYVDTVGGDPVTLRKVGSMRSSKIVSSSNSKEINKLPTQRQVPAPGLHAKSIGQANSKSFIVPSVVPRDSSNGKDLSKSQRESSTIAKASINTSSKPTHIRRLSNTRLTMQRLSIDFDSLSFDNTKGALDTKRDSNFHGRLFADDDAKDSSDEKPTNIKSVTEKCEKLLIPGVPSNQDDCTESLDDSKGVKAVKYVNGVAVVLGRTRSLVERFERRERLNSDEPHTPDSAPPTIPEMVKATSTVAGFQTPDLAPQIISETVKASSIVAGFQTPNSAPLMIADTAKASTMVDGFKTPHSAPQIIPEILEASPVLNSHPRTIEREPMFQSDDSVAEDLVKNHDVLLSTLRSRLTKLQVVRHFWERNDIKGAINAMQKLPDHSVQAEMVSVLLGKLEILNLDLFSCLLPVLLGLLDSKAERHANISLEMLLKLVAVFGPVVRSAISGPPAVGVDLHAEQRLECCNRCFVLLQKIQKYLPTVVRRGGLLAKSAIELNLVLQES